MYHNETDQPEVITHNYLGEAHSVVQFIVKY